MDHIKLTVDKLSVDAVSELVINDKCGAVSIFVGTTRDNFEDKKVLRLEYEAYEAMAVKAMKEICDEVRKKWPAVHGIAIYHRLGNVPCREASVIIAVSSPHRRDSLDAVSHCIELLKAKVPIWKKEVYEGETAAWKENAECSPKQDPEPIEEYDKKLVQITVSNEELERRIQSFIDRKREQINWENIRDFIPSYKEGEEETCARVRTQFIRRSDSKGHLKMRKVHNEWGPQTVSALKKTQEHVDMSLPPSIAERVTSVEKFLNITPVSKDIYKRLKEMEDRINYLQSISPEYAQFWNRTAAPKQVKEEQVVDYEFSAEDIQRKIEELERQSWRDIIF